CDASRLRQTLRCQCFTGSAHGKNLKSCLTLATYMTLTLSSVNPSCQLCPHAPLAVGQISQRQHRPPDETVFLLLATWQDYFAGPPASFFGANRRVIGVTGKLH